MSVEFGASRVTIRRALELVREDGLIAARQGFGWFVATEPVRQSLQSLGTIESQVEGVGKLSERKVEEFAFETPPERVRKLLGVDQVLRVKRVNLADGEPFAVVTVWCPADLGANLSRQDVERRPFYELLDVELRGATQTIGADLVERGRRPVCSACRSARRCCAASGSPPIGTASRSSSASTSSRRTAPSSSSSCRRPNRR